MEEMKIGLIITILILALIGILTSGIIILDMKILCPNFGKAVERPYRYRFLGGGCFIQDFDGRWVQKDNYWNSPTQGK